MPYLRIKVTVEAHTGKATIGHQWEWDKVQPGTGTFEALAEQFGETVSDFWVQATEPPPQKRGKRSGERKP